MNNNVIPYTRIDTRGGWTCRENSMHPHGKMSYTPSMMEIYHTSVRNGDLPGGILGSKMYMVHALRHSTGYREVLNQWRLAGHDMSYMPSLELTYGQEYHLYIRNGSKAYPESTVRHHPKTHVGRVQTLYTVLSRLKYDTPANKIPYSQLELHQCMLRRGYNELYTNWARSGWDEVAKPIVRTMNYSMPPSLDNTELTIKCVVDRLRSY